MRVAGDDWGTGGFTCGLTTIWSHSRSTTCLSQYCATSSLCVQIALCFIIITPLHELSLPSSFGQFTSSSLAVAVAEILLSLLHPLLLRLPIFSKPFGSGSAGGDAGRWSSQLAGVPVWCFQKHLQTNSRSGCGRSGDVGCLGTRLQNGLGHNPTHS